MALLLSWSPDEPPVWIEVSGKFLIGVVEFGLDLSEALLEHRTAQQYTRSLKRAFTLYGNYTLDVCSSDAKT